ncbi:MAG: helix-turn-helix domain-containing protein [bacterium]|nr:helix-turn-helix domain-containing protein [bacterium]
MTDISYKNWHAMSDDALIEFIGKFIKEKRIALNKTQDILAHDAGISRSTLSLLEKGETVNLATLIQVLRTLDQLQVLDVFTLQASISPLKLAKQDLNKRKRASGKVQDFISKSDW